MRLVAIDSIWVDNLQVHMVFIYKKEKPISNGFMNIMLKCLATPNTLVPPLVTYKGTHNCLIFLFAAFQFCSFSNHVCLTIFIDPPTFTQCACLWLHYRTLTVQLVSRAILTHLERTYGGFFMLSSGMSERWHFKNFHAITHRNRL